MAYEVVWLQVALDRAVNLAVADDKGVAAVFDAVDLLAENPRPDGAFHYGSDDLLRIQVGLYRVFVEIHESARVVEVRHIGRV